MTYARTGGTWYLDSEISQSPVNDGSGRYDRVAVQFVGVAADPREYYDVGSAGSSQDDVVAEPEESVPGR